MAIDPSTSVYVNVKAPSSDEKVEDSFVHIEQSKQQEDDDQSPAVLEAQPRAPLEPVVKIITGPKGKDGGMCCVCMCVTGSCTHVILHSS